MEKEKLFIMDGETEREFTAEEYEQFAQDRLDEKTKADELAVKNQEAAEAKAALLTKLGITAEEAILLLS
jgi:hypothetical protein